MRLSKYYCAAIAAFVIWGFFSLALKPLHAYASLDILFYRVFLCVVLMLGINLFFRKKALRETREVFRNMTVKQRKQTLFLTLGGAVLLASNWFFFIYVMNHISVKSAGFAYLVCPILTTLFARFILSEKLNRWQWTAVALSVFSCILLGFNHFRDIFFSLVVAATYALYLVSQRKNTAIDKFLLLTLQLSATALILLPFYPFYSGEVPAELSFYLYIAVIVVFFTIIPLFLNLYALKGMNSSAVGILLYINPLLNFMLAIFYYGEAVAQVQVVAYAVILFSILVFNAEAIFRKRIKILSPGHDIKV